MTKTFCDRCSGEIPENKSSFALSVKDGLPISIDIVDNTDPFYVKKIDYMHKDFCCLECLTEFLVQQVMGEDVTVTKVR